MPQPPPAAVGIRLAEVDTPALVVDLDAFERNLDRITIGAGMIWFVCVVGLGLLMKFKYGS